MKLSDNPELARRIHEELCNWGRWGSDRDIDTALMYGVPPTSKHYRPDAGNVFEPEYSPLPIDEQAGQRTEDVIVLMGLVNTHAQQALIAKFAHTREPVRTPSKGRVEAAMQLYFEMRNKT